MKPPRSLNIWSRRLHRWGSVLVFAPLLLVIATGVLLQLKKQIGWVQPDERRGVGTEPAISMDALLHAARSVPEAEIEHWGHVDRIDVRPGKGIAKVRANNSWEIQIDTHSGEVLQAAYRRSDLIESLHDGSFFGDPVKYALFLPAGVALLLLWLTGIYLWLLPHWARWAGRRGRQP